MKAYMGRMPRVGAGICLLVACLLAGCFWDRPDEAGVVAEVNGTPIRLAELEARYDAGRLGIPVLDNPAVEELRSEYGAVLADMIVTRLVVQELDRLKLSPSPADLAEAEAAVRADYPGDAFERMLLEEHIDPAAWRTMLAERLALEKFSRDVLRPNVRVGVSEAASYYKDHIDAFTRPASVRLLVVSGPDAEAVKAALAAARKSGQGENAPGVALAVLPEAGLPVGWRDALKGRKPGEASQPLPSGREYVGLVLLERLPAAVLDPAKAYARVEAMLAAEKLDKAFAAWLAETLAGARVRVNRQLLAAGQPDGPQAPPAAVGLGPTEVETARVQDAARTYVVGQARKTLADKRAAAGSPTQAGEPPSPAPADVFPAPGVAEGQPAAAAPAPPAAATKADQPAATPASTSTLAEATPPQVGERDSAPAAPPPAVAPDQTGGQPAAPAFLPVDAAAGSPGSPPAPPQETQAQTGPGEVEFTAVKASWILYIADDGRQERVYLKPGKPLRIAYARRLVVRLGSPSVVTCRAGGRETTLDVGQKESRVLEFP